MVSPFGGIPLEDATLAVNVTAWLTTEGLSEEVSATEVAAMTFSLRLEDVLARLLESPL